MDIKITVKVECEPLIQVLNNICTLLAKKETKVETVETEQETEEPKKEKVKEPKAKKEIITAETARQALAELAKEKGKKAAKEILNSFGCNKFSDIPEEEYPELMKKIKEMS